MASLATVLTNVKTALTALGFGAQLTNDYRDDQDEIAAGATRYQIRHQHQAELKGSSVSWETAAIEVVAIHMLSDGTDERAYTEGAMLTQQASMLDREWWQAITGIKRVLSGEGGENGDPQIQGESGVERIGNALVWSVLVIVEITP